MPLLESGVVGKIGTSLATGALKAGGSRFARKFGTPERRKALERCSRAGLGAFLERGLDEGSSLERGHVEGLVEHFAGQEEIHEILVDLLKGQPIEPDELVEAFGDEYDLSTLPGLDLEAGLGGFALAFVSCAVEEEPFQGLIQAGQLIEQTKILRRMLRRLETLGEEGEAVAEADARRAYLRRMRREWQLVPIAALGGEEGAGEEVTLDQVYVELDTETRVALTGAEAAEHRDHPPVHGEPDNTRRLSALEAAEAPHVVFLGEAGAGKSSFVKVLLSRLAAAGLDESSEPPAGIDRDLLPVLVVLRDLSSRLSGLDLEQLSEERRAQRLAHAVREQVVADLSRFRLERCVAGVETAWESGRFLLVLDGLDEVPEALRGKVREAVAAVSKRAKPARVIVTCRVRSYRGEAVLPGFRAYTLAPLDREKIRRFCAGWYEAQRELGRVDAQEAERRGKSLVRAALARDLSELSSNPMLLTTLALIHQRDIEFPDHRVELYEKAIGVLTEKWQKAKVGERLVTSEKLHSILAEPVQLGKILQRLAVEALEVGGTEGEEEAGLPRGRILTLLEEPEYLGELGLVEEFLDYVDQRAGLLVGQGGEPGRHLAYSFPHRTFQEYLAGRSLVSEWDPVAECFARAAEGDLWALAVELGGESLLWVDRKEKELLRLAYGLGASTEKDSEQWLRAILWSGKLAAILGREAVERDTGGPVEGRDYLEKIRPRLLQVMRSELPAVERAAAGRALGVLGDPRPEVTTLDAMEFCWVPAGRFWMGSEDYHHQKPPHELDIPYGYWLARSPVTLGQFRDYVEASGREPGDPISLQGAENHPVLWVSWHEAVGLGLWLTERWRERLQEGWVVTLPSEAEWEKAARGGSDIPAQPVVRSFGAGTFEKPAVKLRKNPSPRRDYPWQGAFDAERANTEETELAGPSASGVFPGGTSPCGCEDLAGNVWEWTRSLWGADFSKSAYGYPYESTDGREILDAPDSVLRVLRGGSFFFNQHNARCATRSRYDPTYRSRNFGFRLVVSPFSPDSDPSGL